MSKIFLGDAPNLPLFTGENGQVGVKEAAAALEALGLPYEVGTWTPELVWNYAVDGQRVNPTVSNKALDGTDIQLGLPWSGTYIRCGGFVACWLALISTRISEITDTGTGAGAGIGGLPFSPIGVTAGVNVMAAAGLRSILTEDLDYALVMPSGSLLLYAATQGVFKATTFGYGVGGYLTIIYPTAS